MILNQKITNFKLELFLFLFDFYLKIVQNFIIFIFQHFGKFFMSMYEFNAFIFINYKTLNS